MRPDGGRRRGALSRSLLGMALLVAGASGCTLVGVPAGVTTGAAEPPAPSAEPSPDSAPEPRGNAAAWYGDAVPWTGPRRFDEVRALWVVRFTMTSEASVRAMVRRADEAGFNTLIVQVRGRADAFYRSSLEPRGESVRGPLDFDPLALTIEEAHARGMAVHGWVNTHLVWGPAERPDSPEHLVNAHPEWLAVPRALGRRLHGVDPRDPAYVDALFTYARDNAASVEGVYSAPSHPEVQDRVFAVWMDLTERYDLDGLHFDYIRYPSGAFDYSRGALDRFTSWLRPRLDPAQARALEAQATGDPYAFAEAVPEAWDEFRREQITRLVTRVYHGVKSRRPGMVVSAAVFPDAVDARGNRFQDWPAWLEAGILDVAVPMAYSTADEAFRRRIADAAAVTGSRERLWAGIGAWVNTPAGTVAKVRIARDLGAGGVVLFSYDWAVGEGSPAGKTPLLQLVGREAFGVGR